MLINLFVKNENVTCVGYLETRRARVFLKSRERVNVGGGMPLRRCPAIEKGVRFVSVQKNVESKFRPSSRSSPPGRGVWVLTRPMKLSIWQRNMGSELGSRSYKFGDSDLGSTDMERTRDTDTAQTRDTAISEKIDTDTCGTRQYIYILHLMYLFNFIVFMM